MYEAQAVVVGMEIFGCPLRNELLDAQRFSRDDRRPQSFASHRLLLGNVQPFRLLRRLELGDYPVQLETALGITVFEWDAPCKTRVDFQRVGTQSRFYLGDFHALFEFVSVPFFAPEIEPVTDDELRRIHELPDLLAELFPFLDGHVFGEFKSEFGDVYVCRGVFDFYRIHNRPLLVNFPIVNANQLLDAFGYPLEPFLGIRNGVDDGIPVALP